MDSFSLDSIRDAFQSDVTRCVAQARASLQRCRQLLSVPEDWSTARQVLSTMADTADAGERLAWQGLLSVVDRITADEALARAVVVHLESACSATETMLTLELDGRGAEASRWGVQQTSETEQMLQAVQSALADDAAPAHGDAVATSPHLVAATPDLLASVQARVSVGLSLDADLEEVEQSYHAIRGSSGMVALHSLADSATAIEMLVAQSRQLYLRQVQALQGLAGLAGTLTASLTSQDAVEPLADVASQFDFDGPSAAGVGEITELNSQASSLAKVMDFDAEGTSASSAGGASEGAEQFGQDLFDSPSLALPPEPEPAPAGAQPAAPAPADGADGFDFAGGPEVVADSIADSIAGSAASTPGGDAIEPELLEIFLSEARECLPALAACLRKVGQDTADAVAWSELARHFHLLKGSAGTVGLAEVSRRAALLEDRCEVFGERKKRAAVGDVKQVRVDAESMLALCQLTLGDGKPQAVPVDANDGLAAVFQEEARSILADADALVAGKSLGRLSNADRGALASLWHRLKGSALLQGSEGIGRLALRLHELCDGDQMTASGHAELTAGITTLRGMLGVALPSVAPQTVGGRSAIELTTVGVTIDAEPAVFEAFQAEVAELVEQIDRIALEIETDRQPRGRLEQAFRCMHTLKGACNTVGLHPTGRMLHEVETWCEHLLQAAALPPAAVIARVLLAALDGVKSNLRQAQSGTVTDWLPRVEQAIKSQGDLPSVTTNASDRSAATGSATPETGNAEAAGRGMLRVSAERLDRLMDLIGELVVHRSQLRSAVGSIGRLQKALKKSRQRLFTTVDRFREQYEFFGLAGQRRKANLAKPQSPSPSLPAAETGAKPVPTNNLGFSDLELDHYEDINILARSLEEIDSDITQIQAQIDTEIENFNTGSDGFGALISGLQNEITAARMVTVDQLFLRLRRPIRDAAERTTREVRVLTEGEDVTLDKTIIDHLYAPLLHLVRNAVAHGIEPAADRLASGKEPVGTVHLAARQESGQIVLEIRDDGRGLDLQALHRIGVERGLIAADTPIDDPAVRQLIFVSGLSTKKQVDDVSGRGVGCDVVRRAIENLSGVIDVFSEAGRGTTFRITMPLTLAIYRALLVKHAGLTLALPISFCERILEDAEASVFESSGVRRLRLDGQFLEMRDLSTMLGIPAERRGRLTVVLRLGPDRIAINIDQVLGQDEIVVKSLGDLLTGHQMFSGVTIDGEGNLILILDATGLFGAVGRTSRPRTIDAAQVQVEEKAPKVGPTTRRRVRVLYADDSLSVRKAAEKFLGDIGADLVLAVDGVDALEKLRAQSVDMVFTDLEMPRMHGFELLREMRYVPAFKDVPVVVVTSRSGDKHRQQAEKLGCNGYLAKPFTPALLQAQICRLTGAQAGAGGLMVEAHEAVR